MQTSTDWKVKKVPDRKRDYQGNAEAGLQYLIYGSYIGTGIPFELMKKAATKEKDTVLKRTGINAFIEPGANVFQTSNGVQVINGNCFTCHSGQVDGKTIIGIGNTLESYNKNFSFQAKVLEKLIQKKSKKDTATWQAYETFGKFFQVMAPDIELNNPGVNPAFRLTEACVQHRDPITLTYREKEQFDIIPYNLGADVPPLWHVKKKNMLYYTGSGRGDFTKLLMQASVLGIKDSAAARKAHAHFEDVLAWLESIEPPAYPKPINQELAATGRKVFETHCSKCHGTYGENETYPNKIVSLEVVKTDPGYALYTHQSPFNDWYNASWFAQSPPYSSIESSLGYVAPPLDGIWATAPYLHNGSVPTVEALLNSKKRPAFWKRSKDSRDFDWDNLGWKYTERASGSGKATFDTSLPGYGNQGHYFGDKLSDDERKAVIEYLKTL
jgi:mono/diheme cytochrome c family protein